MEALLSGSLGFARDESAGASFVRRDGTVWATDKDGLIMGLLAMEMTARTGRDPGELYEQLTHELGESAYEHIDAAATPAPKSMLARLSATELGVDELAGRADHRSAHDGARRRPTHRQRQSDDPARVVRGAPLGTKAVSELYAESFKGRDHLRRIQTEAQAIIERALRRDRLGAL